MNQVVQIQKEVPIIKQDAGAGWPTCTSLGAAPAARVHHKHPGRRTDRELSCAACDFYNGYTDLLPA